MCALIAICFHDTKDNGRSEYSEQCLYSLQDTVDLSQHRLFLIDNKSCKQTRDLLYNFCRWNDATLIRNNSNVGTAAAINMALEDRKLGEVCIKSDNDVTWGQKGWVEELERVIKADKTLGVVGLKRDDVWQNPNHENTAYRTVIEGELEICKDIMGTCTAFSPLLLDKVGYLYQPSVYGFDDVLMSARSAAAGFRNVFLPAIPIIHLDPGTSDYSEWKREEAGRNISEVSKLCNLIIAGKAAYYYDGGLK